MKDQQKQLYAIFDILNLIVDANEVYQALVNGLVIQRVDIASIYWAISAESLGEIEETLEDFKVMNPHTPSDAKEPILYSGLNLLKNLNSTLILHTQAMGIDLVELIKAYVIAMETSTRPVTESKNVDSILQGDGVKSRHRTLLNQSWLFTLCLLEQAVDNRAIAEMYVNRN